VKKRRDCFRIRPFAMTDYENLSCHCERGEAISRDFNLTENCCEKALSLYKKRSDKLWGMVDCFSFIVMDEFGIKQGLTFDEHFRQAGRQVIKFLYYSNTRRLKPAATTKNFCNNFNYSGLTLLSIF